MGKNANSSKKFVPKTKAPYAAKGSKYNAESDLEKNPVWQLSIVDLEHEKWVWKNLTNNDANEILKKLTDYESRKWGEIHQNQKRDHFVAVNELSPEAQKRLGERNLGDAEQLYKLRLSGKLRIWGIRHGNVFKILWLDPEHTVCPSSKK